MDCAVVFFSSNGNTRLAAEEIARRKNAKAFELLEKRGPRKGFFGFMRSGFGAAIKTKSSLKNNYATETKPFDTIYIGSPVWAGNATPAVNRYVHDADFTGKHVYLFFTCASKESDYKPQGGVDHLSDVIKKKGGTVGGVYVFIGEAPGKCVSSEEMSRQVDGAIK